MFEKIVEESFHRGTEYEITNIQKKKKPFRMGRSLFPGTSTTDERTPTNLQQRNLGRKARRPITRIQGRHCKEERPHPHRQKSQQGQKR